MGNNAAIIEGIYDINLPDVPASLQRWGRKVWFKDIEVGVKGELTYVEDGVHKVTHLSKITNIIKSSHNLEIYTQCSIYKLRLLTDAKNLSHNQI